MYQIPIKILKHHVSPDLVMRSQTFVCKYTNVFHLYNTAISEL